MPHMKAVKSAAAASYNKCQFAILRRSNAVLNAILDLTFNLMQLQLCIANIAADSPCM